MLISGMSKNNRKKTPSWSDIKDKFLDATVNIPVDTIKPNNERHRISDEYLETIFRARKNAYLDVAKLKIALRGVIPVRNTKSKSVIPSNYLRRLSKLTGKKWRQKKALHPDDNRTLVKFYSDGAYIDPKKEKANKRLKQLQIYESEKKLEEELEELEQDLFHVLVYDEKPPVDGDPFSHNNFLSDKEKEGTIETLKFEIAKVQKALGRDLTAYDKEYLEDIQNAVDKTLEMYKEYNEKVKK